MASRDPDLLHPYLKAAWERASGEWNRTRKIQVLLTCTYRSDAEQEALFAQGRRGIDAVNRLRQQAGLARITSTENERKVTWARPGQSVHNFKPACAFDIAFKGPDGAVIWDKPGLFRAFAELVCQDPLVQWGIDDSRTTEAKDPPHFQFLGLTPQHLRQGQDPVEVAQYFRDRQP